MLILTLFLFLLDFISTESCASGSCKNNMCSNIPANNQYYLTSFCDKSVACGTFSGNCYEYYSADYARFGCNSVISCCQGSKCVNLKVIDGGPSCAVEDSAGKPVVDASYSTCNFFTGSTSCGYSDKILITCKKTSIAYEETYSPEQVLFKNKFPLGPCSYNSTYSMENSIPSCGNDFNEYFEINAN